MNELENKIRDNANNSSFEFKEEYWDATLLKLKQAEKALLYKKMFWAFFGVLAIGGIACFGFIKGDTLTNNSIAKVENFSNDNNTTKNIFNTNSNNEDVIEKNKLTNNKLRNNNTNNLKNNNINKKFSTNNKNLNENNLNTNNFENNKLNNNSESFSNLSKDNRSGVSKNKKTNNSKETENKNIKKMKSLIKKENEKKSGNNIRSSRVIAFDNSSSLKSDNSSKINSVMNLKETKNTNDNNSSIEIDKSKSRKNDVGIIKENLIPYEYFTKEELATNFSPIPAVLINKAPNKFVLQAFIGTNISNNLGLGKQKSTTFDLPYGGIEIGYLLQNGILLSSGIGWYQRSNLDYSINSATESIYSYGLNRTSSSIKLDKSYWLEIPLKISYPIYNNKHRIGFGFAYSHLLGTESTHTTEVERTAYNFESELLSKTETTINGYSELLNSSSYSLLGYYQFQYNRFGTEIKFHYGLNNIINNKYAVEDKNERNSRLTLTLKYSFL